MDDLEPWAEWYYLNEQPLRKPLPEALRDENLSRATRTAVGTVADLLVQAFSDAELRGPRSGIHAILPPGHDSGWLVAGSHYEAVDVNVSLATQAGPLSRRELIFLEDLGFDLRISESFAVHSILRDRRDPRTRLAAFCTPVSGRH